MVSKNDFLAVQSDDGASAVVADDSSFLETNPEDVVSNGIRLARNDVVLEGVVRLEERKASVEEGKSVLERGQTKDTSYVPWTSDADKEIRQNKSFLAILQSGCADIHHDDTFGDTALSTMRSTGVSGENDGRRPREGCDHHYMKLDRSRSLAILDVMEVCELAWSKLNVQHQEFCPADERKQRLEIHKFVLS